MYVCENEEKFGLFVFCSLSFVCALWSVPLRSRLWDFEARRETSETRERRPRGFSEKGPATRAKKKSRERKKFARDTKKKEGKKKKKKCRRVECVACRRRPSSGARWDQSSRSW